MSDETELAPEDQRVEIAPDPKRNVYQRLHAIMQEVRYVQKDATITGGGSYKAVSHDMVTAKVRPHFIKHGVVIATTLKTEQVIDTGSKSSGGTPKIRFQGVYDVDFINIDDGKDRVTVQVAAHAEDYGDKAPGKAVSYAQKYAILKILMLETGESDEARFDDGPPPKPLTEAEIAGLQAKMEAAPDRKALEKAMQEVLRVPAEAKDTEALESLTKYGRGLWTALKTAGK